MIPFALALLALLQPLSAPGELRRIALGEFLFPFHFEGDELGAVEEIRERIREWRPPQDAASAAFSNIVLVGATNRKLHLALDSVSAPTLADDHLGMRLEWDSHATVFIQSNELIGDNGACAIRVGHWLGEALRMRGESLQEFFVGHGIAFPAGSSISYDEETGVLVARNQAANLDRIKVSAKPFAVRAKKALPPRLLRVGARTRAGVQGDPAKNLRESLARVELARVQLNELSILEAFRELMAHLPGESVQIDLASDLPQQPKLVDLDLYHVPLSDALSYAVRQAGLVYTPTDEGIQIHPDVPGRAPLFLYRQRFTVPTALLEQLKRPIDLSEDPFADTSEVGGLQSTADFRELLRGISFPEGASAVYDPKRSQLTLTNTIENLILAEMLLEGCDLDRRFSIVWKQHQAH